MEREQTEKDCASSPHISQAQKQHILRSVYRFIIIRYTHITSGITIFSVAFALDFFFLFFLLKRKKAHRDGEAKAPRGGEEITKQQKKSGWKLLLFLY